MSSDGSIVIDVTVDTEALKASLQSLNDVVSRGAQEAGSGIARALSDGIEKARASAEEAAGSSDFSNIGNMLAEGLAGGIQSAASRAAAAAESMIENVKSVIKSGVQVQSPSKWAEGIGAFIGEGLANGVSASAKLLAEAADSMIKGFTNSVEKQSRDIVKSEIAAIDEIIAAEQKALEERSRTRELELRQRSIDIAQDTEVKRMAIEYLSDTERKFALEDLEEYRNVLLERERALEEYREAQVQAIKDVSYEERSFAYQDYELKLKLYDEEYLAKIKSIDDGLYAFLSAKNTEMEAVIERIALEDSATAERLAAILDEKNALIEKSRVEKEIREEKAREEKEYELLKRIWEAESYDEITKRTDEYNKWRENEEYKLTEKNRQNKISSLDAEYKAIIETVKNAQKEIDAIRLEGEAAVERAAQAAKTGAPIDLDGEKALFDFSSEQQKVYYENSIEAARKHYADSTNSQKEYYAASNNDTQEYYGQRAELVANESANEYAFLQNFNNSVVTLLRMYIPLWYQTGAELMGNLYSGLVSRYYEVSAMVSRIRAELDSISYGGGGDYPMYGEGGVVTTPRLAIVGDKPEAIIPLSKLDEVIRRTAYMAAPMIGAQGGVQNAIENREVYINQTNNIYQPVKSPAETARAIKNVSREMAHGY